jgi:hypothetical protein
MGATAHFKSLSPWAVQFLRQYPFLTEAFVCWDNHLTAISPATDSMPAEQRRRFREHLALAFPPDQEDIPLEIAERRHPVAFAAAKSGLERLKAEWDSPSLDLEKAWRGILADLDSFPADLAMACRTAIRGGIELGPDLGYEAARILDAPEVQEVARLLPHAVEHYRQARGDLLVELEYVSNYYSDAARQGKGMLLHLA